MGVFEDNHEWNKAHYNPEAMRYGRQRAPKAGVQPLDLHRGDRVKFYGDRRWWKVEMPTDDYVVLTRDAEFGRGQLYTIICWSEGRRGPHDSYGHPMETYEQIGDAVIALYNGEIAMSERRSVRLDIARVAT